MCTWESPAPARAALVHQRVERHFPRYVLAMCFSQDIIRIDVQIVGLS
jgi:hypothetical protein